MSCLYPLVCLACIRLYVLLVSACMRLLANKTCLCIYVLVVDSFLCVCVLVVCVVLIGLDRSGMCGADRSWVYVSVFAYRCRGAAAQACLLLDALAPPSSCRPPPSLLPSFPPSPPPSFPPSLPPSLWLSLCRVLSDVASCQQVASKQQDATSDKTQHRMPRLVSKSHGNKEEALFRRRKLVSMRLADKASKQASSLPPSRMSRLVSKSHRAKVY